MAVDEQAPIGDDEAIKAKVREVFPEQIGIDDLPLLGAEELRAAYELGKLDRVLGRETPESSDPLERALRAKLTGHSDLASALASLKGT